MRAGEPGPSLSVDGDVATVTLQGELDMASAPLLERIVDRAIAAQPRLVRVNLEQVRFADSSAIRQLIRLHRALGSRDGCVELVGAPAILQRSLETLVGDLFPMVAPDEATTGDASARRQRP